MPASEEQRQLDSFIDKFSPEVAARTREELARMRALLPCAIEMVYDNYNALAIGFGPSERASEAVFSLAVFPRWVTLCFLKNGPALPDPEGLLNGGGKRVRHLRLPQASHLDSPAVAALLDAALAMADPPMPVSPPGALSIRSVSAKRRPRKPLG